MSKSNLAGRTGARTRLSLLALVALTIGCTGGTMGACGGLAPLPGGRYMGPKNDNAVAVRLSPNGINYLNNNWQSLVETFAPGRTIHIPIPCTMVDTAGASSSLPINLGMFAAADQGSATAAGRLDGQCDNRDLPADVRVTVTGFSLVPVPTAQAMEGTLQLEVDTGKVYISSQSRNWAGCIGLSGIEASVQYNTTASAPTSQRLKATIKFTIDNKWDKLLAFEVTNITGVGICGASGVPPAPDCLQPQDVAFNGENTCASVYLFLTQIDAIKSFLLRLISTPLQDQVRAAVGKQSCQQCGTGLPGCPQMTNGTSACMNGVCVDPATSKCVPRMLGVEGRASIGALLGSFGAPADAKLDVSFALGSLVQVDQGLTLGTRVGINAVEVASCVAPVAAPPMISSAPPDFDLEAPQGSNYHVGLSFSTSFLNQTFHHVQQAGGLCLSLNTANVGLINTGLFKTFLPSLGKLATRVSRDETGALVPLDAPMMVVLRPGRPPNVTVGQGTFDPMTKKPINPLLTLAMPELSIDFYAMLDDRYARLFTITADISLPLSLIFEGCDKVTPAIGDLRMLITNVHTSNAELLAEDPMVLADLIPAVIGLAEPALAGGLSSFSLPSIGNFKLKVNAVKGLGNIAGTTTYNHLGLFATLLPANASCATATPRTFASLKSLHTPTAAQMKLTGRGLPLPLATLDVRSEGLPGSTEYSFKVDDSLWTDFVPATAGVLEVAHPLFLLQGEHLIAVRSRIAEQPSGVSQAEVVKVVIDWEAPEVSLSLERALGAVVVMAHDTVTKSDKLEFAYAFGDEPASSFGPKRDISLPTAEAKGGVTVMVRDERGNVGKATWRAPKVDETPSANERFGSSSTNTGAGCAVGSSGPLLLLIASLLRARRRRS